MTQLVVGGESLENQQVVVRIKTNVTDLVSKAGIPSGNLTQGSLGLFFTTENTSDNKFNTTNREVTYRNSSWEIQGDPSLLWKNKESKVTFYAYYPFNYNQPSTLYITLPSEQNAENILSNDLLFSYPSVTSQIKSNGVININFNHALSKLQLQLSTGTELAAQYTISSVVLDNCTLSGNFNLETCEWALEDNYGSISLHSENGLYECLLIPQSSEYVITITVNIGNTNRIFKYIAPMAQDFLLGTQYTIPVKIGGDVVTIGEVDINPWEDIDKGELITE